MQRQTLQRTAIETVFAEAGRPLAPREILAGAQGRVPSLNLATVYRTLKRLIADRKIAPVTLPGETPRYELRAAADRHHHHFRCDRCDSVFDLEGCVEGLERLLPEGFRMTDHDIVLYGFCSACRA